MICTELALLANVSPRFEGTDGDEPVDCCGLCGLPFFARCRERVYVCPVCNTITHVHCGYPHSRESSNLRLVVLADRPMP